MSKRITAGDTLTVGDLTDDHLGAVIEVGPVRGFTTRLELKAVSAYAPLRHLWSTEGFNSSFRPHDPVTVITPPPVVQPDEPTKLGQLVRIEDDNGWWGMVVDPKAFEPFLSVRGTRWSWSEILDAADDRQIIVSDPPRWPDETPEEDTTLPEVVETRRQWNDIPMEERRKFTWITATQNTATPCARGGWRFQDGGDPEDVMGWDLFARYDFPMTRGERVE